MALDKEILGQALFNRANDFNEVDFENINEARLNFWKAIAEEVIQHFKDNATLNVPGLGLNAGVTAVTGTSVTGTIE